jgi:hypothetical protein
MIIAEALYIATITFISFLIGAAECQKKDDGSGNMRIAEALFIAAITFISFLIGMAIMWIALK